jgi:hypothetical protein
MDFGSTMIVEIPDPTCVGASSPFADSIANARAQMDEIFTVTDRFQSTSRPVIVTGVGFWEFAHGKTGRAPKAFTTIRRKTNEVSMSWLVLGRFAGPAISGKPV